MERRLARRKIFFLKGGGGGVVGDVTFIPSTLFGLPTYFLSLLTNPTVANRLENLWDFLKIWLGDEFKLVCFI